MKEKFKTLSKPEKWLIYSIILLFLIGGMTHFLFDLTGRNVVAGAIFPVNESVWEHLKMAAFPIFLWWLIYYLINRMKENIEPNRWFAGCLISMVIAISMIIDCSYTYTGALGIESLVIDVLIFLVALIFGQLFGLMIYRYGKGWPIYVSLSLIGVILLQFVIFTYLPPAIPLFEDLNTGTYGIR
jgi:hypothetical protein